MNDTITAIIPARAGSRRLKDKNVAMFRGETLLSRKINQLRRVPTINRVIVTSDSVEYLRIAMECGADAHVRAPEFCDEVSQPFGAVVRSVCQEVAGDHILWAPCTSPLVEETHYFSAIAQYFYQGQRGFDSLMSVQPFKRYVWDENGPLNYKLGLGHVPSQQLPEFYFVADAIQIAPRQKMIEWSYFHGPNPFRYKLDKRDAVDIDDALDLACAKAWSEME